MSKMVGYIRVSTKDQNLDRQREQMRNLGIEDKYIYEDKDVDLYKLIGNVSLSSGLPLD